MGEKSLFEAYLLALTPLGMLGGLHFYLGRPYFGLLYFCTLGVFGIGWIVDIFRTPFLVKEANEKQLCKKDPTLTPPLPRSVIDAYIVWFPLGLFGLHHVYLKNSTWAMVYSVTAGLFLVGWVVDAFYMVKMVNDLNTRLSDPDEKVRREARKARKKAKEEQKNAEKEAAENDDVPPTVVPDPKSILKVGGKASNDKTDDIDEEEEQKKKRREMRPALALGLSPLGLLGAHHYYMNRSNWGLIYTCTLGLAGTGWIRDWFRIYFLVQRSNEIIAGERDKKEKTLDDAYMIWFPFGILGAHHFYLGRFTWGLIYMATAGVFTIGWILDVFRMPILVRESNQRRISMKAEDVEGNITPAFDDYNDNSVTLNAGDGKEEAGDDSKKDAGEVPSEDKIPEVKMASLQGAPNLVPNTK